MCLSEAGSSASGLILPTKQFSLFGGNVRVFAWGKPYDWNRMATDKKLDQFATLAHHAKECGVKRVFTPLAFENPSLTGEAVLRERTVGTVIDDDPSLYREKIDVDDVEFYFGGDGDGVRLTGPGAYFLPSADCYMLAFRMRNGLVVGCHGGRNSLIEPKAIRKVHHSEYQSVVNAAMRGWYNRLDELESAMLLGIKGSSFTHPFDHPQYGETNKEMAAHLVREFGPDTVLAPYDQCPINLEAVVRYQLQRLGAPVDPLYFEVDPTDTATELDSHGERVWHSCRMGDTTRNGVLVVRMP
ncbi:MAG TPA: hypothetical protein VK145_01485 [Candidatus Nanoarchaeia archaeon]|nr:hypothetical protein [Candidatus Nanoarchaeia archaeon]